MAKALLRLGSALLWRICATPKLAERMAGATGGQWMVDMADALVTSLVQDDGESMRQLVGAVHALAMGRYPAVKHVRQRMAACVPLVRAVALAAFTTASSATVAWADGAVGGELDARHAEAVRQELVGAGRELEHRVGEAAGAGGASGGKSPGLHGGVGVGGGDCNLALSGAVGWPWRQAGLALPRPRCSAVAYHGRGRKQEPTPSIGDRLPSDSARKGAR